MHNLYGKVRFLKHRKKPIKRFLFNFFSIYSKCQLIFSKKMLVKGLKIFLKKKKKLKYGRKRYRNLTEDEKQRLVEYRKNYSKIQKIKTDSFIDSVKSLHEMKKFLNFLFLSRKTLPFIAFEEHY